jgi:hypothetical protein
MTVIAVGTAKGGYLLEADCTIRSAALFPGWKVTAWADTGDGGALAALGSNWFGASLQRSDDLDTWETIGNPPAYDDDRPLEQIWTLAATDDVLYAGVEEAGLFKSNDGGSTWEGVAALNDLGARGRWMPGLGGLCAHHVLANGDRLMVAISAVGVFRSDDRGASFTKVDTGVTTAVEPTDALDEGHCVHSIVAHPDDPDRIWRQDHSGVYRSIDGGGAWHRIEAGLPASFGFPIGRDTSSGRLFVVPMESDENRVSAEGRFRVFRSDDDGDSWHVSGTGWDESPAYDTVLRNAMATNGAGSVVVGTTGGNLWLTSDSGEHWAKADLQFPRILSVEFIG